MRPRVAFALALAFVLVVLPLAGCVEGEPRFFEDESARVESLRVNAYAEPTKRVAHVEVHGVGPENRSHAFEGVVVVELEAQENGTGEATYRPVRSWRVEVDADNFTTPTTPFFTLRVPSSEIPSPGTYRAWANATIDGRSVTGEPALFHWPG